jgi:hypothetical protein
LYPCRYREYVNQGSLAIYKWEKARAKKTTAGSNRDFKNYGGPQKIKSFRFYFFFNFGCHQIHQVKQKYSAGHSLSLGGPKIGIP